MDLDGDTLGFVVKYKTGIITYLTHQVKSETKTEILVPRSV